MVILIFGKKIAPNNPIPPTVFAAHHSNFAQTLEDKLEKSFRSRIFEFASQIFFRIAKRQKLKYHKESTLNGD